MRWGSPLSWWGARANPQPLTAAVHAQGNLIVIDVSQSVDLDHPQALHFLREDAGHINAFFRAHIPVLTTRELFEFAVDPSITASNMAAALAGLRQAAASRTPAQRAAAEQQDAVCALGWHMLSCAQVFQS